MENKPIITCHGDQNLFTSLHQLVVQSLPKEPVEWRRSYGRPPRTINVHANFVPFNPDILPGDDDYTLLGRPFFHTYWTDCDVDTYKAMVREDISEWMGVLKAKSAADWLIIVVVHDENKVKTKLLRQSVIDKVRSDFCSKQNERCIVLTEPFRNDSKSSECWHLLLTRMRQLLLYSFNRHLSQFEEYMRAQRERRVEAGWSFTQYFLLQEELAFMFEMLGLFEDALVQYDELDALFTQFVLNHAAGDSAAWLSQFMNNKVTNWDGLCLSQPINIDKRQLIKYSKASLLDFRNYLFSRQCTLLFLILRPWEVAQRAIPFLHNCIKELAILELTLPAGAVACWVFLSCLEVLTTCEKTTESGQMEVYSLHTANLWDYARNKLYEAAEAAGLLPGRDNMAHQESHRKLLVKQSHSQFKWDDGESAPLKKLKEALSSNQAFKKHYLELSELSMGTYKHIGRIRSARFIGMDLADFYMKLGEPQKAEGFLMDALKTYRQEDWEILADHTRLKLATCQKSLPNKNKYMKSCFHVAASKVLDRETRNKHFEEAMGIANAISEEEEVFHMRTRPSFHIHAIVPESKMFVVNTECRVTVTVTSNLPQPVTMQKVSLALCHTFLDQGEERKELTRSRNPSACSAQDVDGQKNLSGWVLLPEVLDIETQYEYEVDKSLASSSMVCKTVLRRMDSNSTIQDKDIKKTDFTRALHHEGTITLQPGKSALTLTGKVSEAGTLAASQLCLKMGGLEFLKSVSAAGVCFNVLSEEPSIEIRKPKSGMLVAGIPQQLSLHLHPGTYNFNNSCSLKVSASEGLEVTGEGLTDGVLTFDHVTPHQDLTIDLQVLANILPDCKDSFDAKLKIEGDWLEDEHIEHLTFLCPLSITHKLQTAGNRKFIHVILQGTTNMDMEVSNNSLTTEVPNVELVNMYTSQHPLVVSKEQCVSYMWEIKGISENTQNVDVIFSVSYKSADEEQTRQALFSFNVEIYKTLYTVEWSVKEADKTWQVGKPCQLQIKVIPMVKVAGDTILYQVHADAMYWNISGKTSGILKIDGKEQITSLDAIPLVGGFLPLPSVKLQKYLDQNSRESESADYNVPEVMGFSRGQVYNRSAASQIHIIPAANTSQVEIS